jgi:dTDP-4-dehydrorhamnose 3,5-epimerase
MSRFNFHATPLAGLCVVERKPVSDERGFLARLFCADELGEAGWRGPVAQVNHTLTRKKGALRGMHFQHPPHAETKLVSCLRGAVWDVAVDLRAGSPTFLQWHAQELSPANGRALLIPAGFAHGFQTLGDDCELLYLHSAAYHAPAEGGLHPQDPRLAIAWPLDITEASVRDMQHALLEPDFAGISL